MKIGHVEKGAGKNAARPVSSGNTGISMPAVTALPKMKEEEDILEMQPVHTHDKAALQPFQLRQAPLEQTDHLTDVPPFQLKDHPQATHEHTDAPVTAFQLVARPKPAIRTDLPVQRQIIFSEDVEKQYTKNSYLTALWVEAQKHNKHITFDNIRQMWINAESSGEEVRLPDDIPKALAALAKFARMKAPQLRPAYDKDKEVEALDEAGTKIPKTEQTGLTAHRRAVRENAGIIFPPAVPEPKQEWSPEEAGIFEPKLPTVDYATWDNLLAWQKKFLFDHEHNVKELEKALHEEVAKGKKALSSAGKKKDPKSRAYNEYIIALFSHLATITNNPGKVATEADLEDDGLYLTTIINVRKGAPDKDMEAYKATPVKESDAARRAEMAGHPPISWLNEEYQLGGMHIKDLLREDAPFLRQRSQQINRAGFGPDELDILRKWASGGSKVQEQNSNMDTDVLGTIRFGAGKKGKQSAVANINLVDKLLAQIKPITGILYGAYPRNDSLREGHLFTQGSPMSASESAGGTVAFSKNAKGDVDRYVIYATGHNGIPISTVVPGVGQGQREVLFRAQATFKVLSIKEGNFGANVTRQVTMIEQEAAISQASTSRHDDAAVRVSQDVLLNEKDKWLTRLPSAGIDAGTQAWFISNYAGGSVEGASDASFAFPYGKKTAQNWHDVITDDKTDIWAVDGFLDIGAKLLGRNKEEMHFIQADEDPGSWGDTVGKEEAEKLHNNGLVIEMLYNIQQNLEGAFLKQIAEKGGATFSPDERSFTIRLKPEQIKLIKGTWVAKAKAGTVKEDGSHEYTVSQKTGAKARTLQPASKMKATNEMQRLLIAQAGGSPDGSQLPLSEAEARAGGAHKLTATGKNKVSYKKEDKRATLAGILKDGKAAMEAIKEGPDRLDHFSRLAARVQQQLSVLHPFHDGNGRISRAYAYLILRRGGYQQGSKEMPRLPSFDQDKDQSTPTAEWQEQFTARVKGSSKGKEREKEKAPETDSSKAGTYEAALGFIKGRAGDWIAKPLEDTDQEQEETSKKTTLLEEDMWLVNEMLAYINKRPEWLSEKLKKQFEDLERQNLFDSPETIDQYKEVLKVKKLLLQEIVAKMSSSALTEKPDVSSAKGGSGADLEEEADDEPAIPAIQAAIPPAIRGILDRVVNQGYKGRLALQINSALEDVARGGQDDRAVTIRDNYVAARHGTNEHLIAYMVFFNDHDNDSAATILDRLTTIVERAEAFYSWEEEVEHVEEAWVLSQALAAGVNRLQEMIYRTRLAQKWMDRHGALLARLDDSQRATVQGALQAAENARREAAQIGQITDAFIDGQQLFQGDCLFVALANSTDMGTVNATRATIVGRLSEADVLPTPIDELHPLEGDSREAQQAQVALARMRREGITLDAYRQFMGTSGVWGGDPEIKAWSRANHPITVYILDAGNVAFRAIQNGAAIAPQNVATVLGQINRNAAIAIRNTGNHYVRMLPRPPQAADHGRVERKDKKEKGDRKNGGEKEGAQPQSSPKKGGRKRKPSHDNSEKREKQRHSKLSRNKGTEDGSKAKARPKSKAKSKPQGSPESSSVKAKQNASADKNQQTKRRFSSGGGGRKKAKQDKQKRQRR